MLISRFIYGPKFKNNIRNEVFQTVCSIFPSNFVQPFFSKYLRWILLEATLQMSVLWASADPINATGWLEMPTDIGS